MRQISIARVVLRALALTGLVFLGSCTLFRHPRHAAVEADRPSRQTAPVATAATPSGAPAARIATTTHRIGVVRVIGHGQRFVLIEVPSTGTVPLPGGRLLRCCPSPDGDLATNAILRVSLERRRPYIVADVVSGEPHIGDTVFLGPESTPAAVATGPAVLPTATSGVLPILLPAPAPTPKTP